jgi:pimeloyl-ACP methyl ester carboxylesterase
MPDSSTLYRSPQAYAEVMAHYDAALERLPVPYESLMVPTRFGETHVLVMGNSDAPAVVLLHGLVADALAMRTMFADFARTYRVYAPDAIGYSGKSAPTRPEFDGYAEWLLELFDALHLQQARLVGISFGGWLSLKFSSLAPQRVAHLALMSSAGFVAVSPFTLLKLLPVYLPATIPFAGHGSARRFVRFCSAPAWQPDAETFQAIYLLLKGFKAPREFPPRLTDDDLSRISAPTLLLMGQYERFFKAEPTIARARALLPNLSAAEILPGVGHMMNLENPELVNARILRFLSEGE